MNQTFKRKFTEIEDSPMGYNTRPYISLKNMHFHSVIISIHDIREIFAGNLVFVREQVNNLSPFDDYYIWHLR